MKHIKPFLLENENTQEFTFSELPTDIQEKIIEKDRDKLQTFILDIIWDDYAKDIIKNFIEELEENYGIIVDIDGVSYNGFYNQGDGASFTAKRIDTETFLKKALGMKNNAYLQFKKDDVDNNGELDNLVNDLENLGFNEDKLEPDDIEIIFYRTDNRYSHENTVTAEIVIYDENIKKKEHDKRDFKKFTQMLETDCNKWLKNKCKELYKNLKDEYDSLISDVGIRYYLLDSEYKFDKNGNLINETESKIPHKNCIKDW